MSITRIICDTHRIPLVNCGCSHSSVGGHNEAIAYQDTTDGITIDTLRDAYKKLSDHESWRTILSRNGFDPTRDFIIIGKRTADTLGILASDIPIDMKHQIHLHDDVDGVYQARTYVRETKSAT